MIHIKRKLSIVCRIYLRGDKVDWELIEKIAELSNNSLIANVVVTVLSVITGGVVTLFITKYTLKRQFDNDQRRLKENELKSRKHSLLVILHELSENHVLIKNLLTYFDQAGVKDEPASILKYKYTFNFRGWDQCKFEVIPISEKENILVLIDYLYFQLRSMDISKSCTRYQLTEYLSVSGEVTAKIRILVDSTEIC